VQDFKRRPDGGYDPADLADLAKLAKVNLTNLKDWNYFTKVTSGGKPRETRRRTQRRLDLRRQGGASDHDLHGAARGAGGVFILLMGLMMMAGSFVVAGSPLL
jgi:hypothetical protein